MKTKRTSSKILIGLIVAFAMSFIPIKTYAADWLSNNSLPTTSGEYELTKNVVVTDPWHLTSGQEITLDLKGYSITFNYNLDGGASTKTVRVSGGSKLIINDSSENTTGEIIDNSKDDDTSFYVLGGLLELNAGNFKSSKHDGLLIAMKGSNDNTQTNYSVITLGEKATASFINEGSGWGFSIIELSGKKHSYGCVGNIKGTLIGGGIYINGSVNVMDGEAATPTFNISSTASVNSDVAMYGAGYAIWNIDGGVFTGENALSIKSGIYNISGGKFISNGSYSEIVSANSSGPEVNGSAISITSNDGYAPVIKLNITDGEFISANAYGLYEGIALKEGVPVSTDTHVKEIKISGGKFSGKLGAMEIFNSNLIEPLTITGVYLSSTIDYLDNDHVLIHSGDDQSYLYKVINRSLYAPIEGNNSTWDGKAETLDIKFNGLLEDFERLLLDGDIEIDENNYYKESGSTIIKLKSSYLKTLSAGDHTLTAVYTNGAATATFKVEQVVEQSAKTAKAAVVENPSTVDNIGLFTILSLLSAIGLGTSCIYIKNKIND